MYSPPPAKRKGRHGPGELYPYEIFKQRLPKAQPLEPPQQPRLQPFPRGFLKSRIPALRSKNKDSGILASMRAHFGVQELRIIVIILLSIRGTSFAGRALHPKEALRQGPGLSSALRAYRSALRRAASLGSSGHAARQVKGLGLGFRV